MKFHTTVIFILLSVISFGQGSLSTLTFDGVDDRITGTNTGLTAVTNNFTMEMWVNPTATLTIRAESNTLGVTTGTGGQRYAVFPTHGGGGCATVGDAGLGISVGTNGIQVFEHKHCHMPPILVYNATLPTGWNHIALVVTAKQPQLYLNGVLVRTGLTSNMNNVFPSAQLGTNVYGNYAGNIDEFRIWNTNRSQAEIRDNMCKRLIGSETNLIRYYRFDEGAGTTLTDASPSAINGTLTSGPAWATSAAAIGNTSVHHYTTAWTGIRVTHSSPEGDSLTVSAVSSATINAIHIYHITTVPNILTGITGLGGNDHYYGVFKSFTAGGGGTYTATYYYRENDSYIASSSVADPDYAETNLRVFTRSNNSSTPWVMNATAPAPATKTITLAAQSTEFILAHVNSLADLPVELTAFDAHYSNGNVILKWETQSETNNQGFFVERSVDGINFENIRFVNGAGNSNSTNYYLEKDTNPLQSIAYYRLNQIDFNGENHYSEIKMVQPSQDLNNILIYPNPSNGIFNLITNSFAENEISIVIRDISGREHFSKKIPSTSDHQIIEINLENKLATGTYFITTSTLNELHTQKLIVK